jgi:hypothetical protein
LTRCTIRPHRRSRALHLEIERDRVVQHPAPHRLAPVSTKSISRPPHWPHTSRLCQTPTGVSAPYRAASSPGSGSTRWPHPLHQTTILACAAAVLPSVAGGPATDLKARPAHHGRCASSLQQSFGFSRKLCLRRTAVRAPEFDGRRRRVLRGTLSIPRSPRRQEQVGRRRSRR